MSRLTKLEHFKSLIGKKILGCPTGNIARTFGNNPVELVEFEVLGVARKYVKLKNKFNQEDNYSPKTGATQKLINQGYGYNSGYMFFENKEAYDEYAELSSLYSLLRTTIRDMSYYKDFNLTKEEVEQVLSILKKA